MLIHWTSCPLFILLISEPMHGFNAFLHSLKSKDNLFWFEHGDLNDANYLIDDDGTIRMIDFGNSSFGGYDKSIRDDIYFS